MVNRCKASFWQQFSSDAIPMKIEIDLKEVTAEVLVENWGKWHKSCYLKFNNSTPQSPNKASKRPLEPPVEQRKS